MMNKVKKIAAIATLATAMAATAAPNMQAQAAAPKLNKTSMTVYAWKTKTLKLKNNTKGVKWSSTKPSVASVSKGRVKGKKAGKATIKATVGKKAFKCKVTVKDPYLNLKSLSLEKGESATLKLTGTKAQSFRTDNPGAARVTNKGKVVAKGAGAATISVVDTEGRTYKCAVEVADPEGNGPAAEGPGQPTQPTTPETPVQPEQPTVTPEQPKEPAKPAHQHTWAKHWAYDVNGKAYNDTDFCTDVTCTENKGFGLNNGWMGETLPGYGNGNTEPSHSGNGNNDNGTNNSGAAGNTGNNTENGNTGATTTTGSAVHVHSWTVPVMEDYVDYTGAHMLMITGTKCGTCGETSHKHTWDKEVTKQHGSAQIVTDVKCSVCGDTMTLEEAEKFRAAQNRDELTRYWLEKNTAGLSDLEKARTICAWINSWEYGTVSDNYTEPLFQMKAMCQGSNGTFVDFCKAAGLEAEIVNVNDILTNHAVSKVKVNGAWIYTDATAGGGQFFMVTEEGFDLWCDWMDGIVTDEEYDQWMGDYEV